MKFATRFAAVLFATLAPLALAAGNAVQRPIGDFLAAQGTVCIDDGGGGCLLFVPPDPNFLGWSTPLDESTILFAGVDYAGLANAYASGEEPVIRGSVTERALKDGTAEVTVNMHVTGANVWVTAIDMNGDMLEQIANKPTMFGHRPTDVLAGAAQALGEAHFRAVFINTAPGAALPDILEYTVLGRPGLKTLAFSTHATGGFTAEYGVEEGTPGRCTIVQTGLFGTHGKGRALLDGFPVETINLQVVGN